jgi:hypothetical protein
MTAMATQFHLRHVLVQVAPRPNLVTIRTDITVVTSWFVYLSDRKIKSPRWSFKLEFFFFFVQIPQAQMVFFHVASSKSTIAASSSGSFGPIRCMRSRVQFLFEAKLPCQSFSAPDPLLGLDPCSSRCSPSRARPKANRRRSQARTGPAHARQTFPPAGQVAGQLPDPAQSLSVFLFILQICLFHIFQTITPNKMCYI